MGTPPGSTAGSGLPYQDFNFVKVEVMKEPGFATLGIEVSRENGTALRVESIDEHGLVGRHNQQQDSEESKILVGDRIIEANGIRHDPNRILHECKAMQHISFTLCRDQPRGGSPVDGAAGSTSKMVGCRESSNLIETTEQPRKDVATGAMCPKAEVTPSSLLSALQGDGTPKVKESTPQTTRLRPEAQVFVPSAKKAVAEPLMLVPPGLDNYEQYDVAGGANAGLGLQSMGPLVLPMPSASVSLESATAAAMAAQAAVVESAALAAAGGMVAHDNSEEVKRALFP
jgi:hypothetical protein